MVKMGVGAALRLGREHLQAGRLPEAIAVCRSVLEAAPEEYEALRILAAVAHCVGQNERALEFISRAIALNPASAECYSNLSAILQTAGRFPEAEAAARQGLAIAPGYADAYNDLGNSLESQGRRREAEAAYRQAFALDPAHADAHTNLAMILQSQGRLAEAEVEVRQALALRPDFAMAENTLGNVLLYQMRLEEADAAFHRALALRPDLPEAENNLGATLLARGLFAEARQRYLRAVELRPEFSGAYSNALTCEQYFPDVTPQRLAAAHAEWYRRCAEPLGSTWRPHANSRDPQRRLRLGFVSCDLAAHPVGYLIVRVLESLDRQQCESVCYSDRTAEDPLSARIRAAAHHWHRTWAWTDEQLAEQVRADGIDILFDLNGHTGHRPLVFARKPAPIQITWIGYEGTTGLKAMDYILADRQMIPPGEEHYYCEQVLRMPDDYLCYAPPEGAPPPGPLPAQQRGYLTFGCFNNPAKITPQVVAVWAAILQRVPGARLVLKYRAFNEEATQRRYQGLFAAHGIDAGRLDMLGWSAYPEYLAHYQQIDVMLDPFPFGGGATACESLWMGVPIVTAGGATFAGRHALTHLQNIGLPEFVAADRAAYVELAARLADDLPRLAAIRATLRPRMAASPLCDGPRFAAHFLRLLREVWRRWCAGSQGP